MNSFKNKNRLAERTLAGFVSFGPVFGPISPYRKLLSMHIFFFLQKRLNFRKYQYFQLGFPRSKTLTSDL